MTEMVYGSIPQGVREPVLPRWWRTVDKVSLVAVLLLFGVGLLLGLAASVPLATKNGLPPFHYVERQAAYGVIGLTAMILVSMMPPTTVRRLGVTGFALAFAALLLLPFFGTDFGKGAVRWFSLGFASFQPSEFLKPCFAIVTAWLISAQFELNGPPGKMLSFGLCVGLVLILAAQPDYGQAGLIMMCWGAIYFVGGAPILLISSIILGVLGFGSLAYHNSEHVARRINGFLAADVDPRTQLGYATNAIQEGGFFGVGLGQGQVKWSLPDAHTDFIIAVAAEEYGVIAVWFILLLYATVVIMSLTV